MRRFVYRYYKAVQTLNAGHFLIQTGLERNLWPILAVTINLQQMEGLLNYSSSSSSSSYYYYYYYYYHHHHHHYHHHPILLHHLTVVLSQTFFFVIKPTRCTNFTNLFCHETLHVSDISSVHHQEFFHCTLSNGICHTCLYTAFEQDQDGIEFHPGPARKLFTNLYDIYHC